MTDKEMQDNDYQWFLENIEELYKKHGNKYAVVKNKLITNVLDTFEEALEYGKKTEKLGTFLIQYIYENKEAMRSYFSGHNDGRLVSRERKNNNME